MAAKIILLLALAAAVVKSQESNNICDCDTEEKQKEKTILWEVLNKFATKVDSVSDEERDMYATLPGMLSPLLRCECMESTRKKRKVFPEPVESVEEMDAEVELRAKKSVKLNDRRCPSGFALVGVYCYNLDDLE